MVLQTSTLILLMTRMILSSDTQSWTSSGGPSIPYPYDGSRENVIDESSMEKQEMTIPENMDQKGRSLFFVKSLQNVANCGDVEEVSRIRNIDGVNERDVKDMKHKGNMEDLYKSINLKHVPQGIDNQPSLPGKDIQEDSRSINLQMISQRDEQLLPSGDEEVVSPGRGVQEVSQNKNVQEVPQRRNVPEVLQTRDLQEVSRDVQEISENIDAPEESQITQELLQNSVFQEVSQKRDVPEVSQSRNVEVLENRNMPELSPNRDVQEVSQNQNVQGGRVGYENGKITSVTTYLEGLKPTNQKPGNGGGDPSQTSKPPSNRPGHCSHKPRPCRRKKRPGYGREKLYSEEDVLRLLSLFSKLHSRKYRHLYD